MNEENEALPTPTVNVHDENFRKVVREYNIHLDEIVNLGYRGFISDLTIREIDRLIYALGLIQGQLEAARGRLDNSFDSAERKTDE